MSTINDKFKERLNYLNTNSKINPPKEIKKDTFNKYLRGERFPTADNLEIIKEHYHVSYSYLFGEFDNDELKTAKESIGLGLDKDVIEKLNKIQTSDNKYLRNNKNFAINIFLKYIDFNMLGNLLTFPSYNNKNITSEEYYDEYRRFFKSSYANELKQQIKENEEKTNYKVYKLINNLCKATRKSKSCVDIFKEHIITNELNEEEFLKSIERDYYQYEYDDDDNDDSIDYEKIEFDKLIEDRKKEIGK